ncbi:hypothetical protein LTR37_001977 [Vermiconidia calcicola]|uniref:Uncharacterized protein n=1 Tax=Vermiconidia calcicola TaxID=1690605 RepID=A0ACC3NUK8_9PEZI|nr:hypothetical protein LTR37_001977 [Vermiconidia calcicola]
MPGKPKRMRVERGTPEDMDELVRVEYECFPNFVREAFLRCSSEADLPRLTQSSVNYMMRDPHVVWIKVVDNASGKIVAGSQWKVYPSSAPESSDDEPPPWLTGEMRERAAKELQLFNERRRVVNPGGYVHLHVCFTRPSLCRRAAGAMMLKWGRDLADALFLPAWIEASAEGSLLYKTFGF